MFARVAALRWTLCVTAVASLAGLAGPAGGGAVAAPVDGSSSAGTMRLVSVGMGGVSATASDQNWRVVVPPAVQGRFNDVAVIRTGELWAVGTAQAGQQSHGVIAHRRGGRWDITALPAGSRVTSVAARPGAVWAVGAGSRGDPMILRSMGNSWQPVAAAPAGSRLYGVAVTSPSNVWIAGSVIAGGTLHPLALHFDGSRWEQFVLPDAGEAIAVDTLDADHTWIVGSDYVTFTAAIWHWNGTGWRQARLPAQVPPYSYMTSVIARRDGTVWAAGNSIGGGCCDAYPVAVRHTSRGWRWMNPPQYEIVPSDVLVGGSPHHATLVGYLYTGDSQNPGMRVPRIRTWTGRRWIAEGIQGFTQPPFTDSELTAVDGDGRGGAWAVGYLGSNVLVIHRRPPPRA